MYDKTFSTVLLMTSFVNVRVEPVVMVSFLFLPWPVVSAVPCEVVSEEELEVELL
ncbi:MAG: hypothetical protein IJA20_03095 [Methanocorpusculum sp.]|nr:hypothetical protein [Methanocorpusculum sp.]